MRRDPDRPSGFFSNRNSAAEERALVSCQPLSAVFEAVEREGRDPAELLVGVGASREHLLDRRRRVHWDDFRTVIENATRDWSDEQIIEFGRGLVHTRAQRPFVLIAKHMFSVSDFYRAVCSPRTGYGPAMFPCMDATFVQLGEGKFEASLTMQEGFRHCPAFFAITKGNFTGIPEVLGSPPAQVRMEQTERGARYDIVAEERSSFLARVRKRISLPFHSGEVAAELQEAHVALRSRFDALQNALRERERTLQALRQCDERNRMLVENVGDAFFVLDEDGFVVDVNGRACQSLGYERDELIGMPMFTFETEWDEERFVEAKADLVDGVPVTFEGVHRRRDGSKYPVEVRGTWVSTGNGPRQFYSLVRDVSDIRRAQEEREKYAARLRRSQKLEALGTLAGGIMHDFNNLLQAIYGYTELACASVAEDSPVRENLEHVLQACQHGEQIARQILTFSKVTEHDRHPTEVTAAVRQGLRLMKATLPATIEIREDLAAEGAMVMADGGQMQQVLMNLCTNAAHAMEPDGGVLEVSLRRLDVSALEARRYPGLSAGPHVCLDVRDEGTGIPPEILDRIFDPFFTTKEGERGTGLGLAVVHGVVQTHGGAIDVENRPSGGTQVRALIPCHEDTTVNAARVDRPASTRGTGRILVVDDDPAVADLLERSLVKLGYQVDAFVHSERALARFCEHPEDYEIVITDQTMPTLTGLHLAERMTAVRPELPVLLISGMGTPTDHDELARAGVLEVLPKPFTSNQLSEVLARNLNTAGA